MSPAAPQLAPSDAALGALVSWIRARLGLRAEASGFQEVLTALGSHRAGEDADRLLWDALSRLDAGDEELQQRVIEAATIRETSFFRHLDQLELLRELGGQWFLEAPSRPLRVLSAGCASGEEAYSCAAAVDSVAGPGCSFEVVGVDVNLRALEIARAGSYGRWSLRNPPPEWAAGALTVTGSAVSVSPRLREHTAFVAFNLSSHETPPLLPEASFDFVFCQNVLMYFVPEAAARVLTRLTSLLVPTGVLVLSAVDAVEAELIPSGFRRLKGNDSVFVSDRSHPPPRRPAAHRKPSVKAQVRSSAPGPVASPDRRLAEAKALLDQGQLARAGALCEELSRQRPLDSQVSYLAALVALGAGKLERAEGLLRGTLERDGSFAMAHFALATLLRKTGRRHEARGRLVRLSKLLAALPAGSRLPGPEEVTCEWLRAVVRAELEA